MTRYRNIHVCALLSIVVTTHTVTPQTDTPDSSAIIEPLPILSYDTDAGLGYGLKVVFRNQLGNRESFDLLMFNSTEGERWYSIALSFTAPELRQGTTSTPQ